MPVVISSLTPSPVVENLRPGGFTVIYGPAGSGKTALAQWLAKQVPGVVLADESEIAYGNKTWPTRHEAAGVFLEEMKKNGTHGIWTLHARKAILGGPESPLDLHHRSVERGVVEVASMVLAIDYHGAGKGTVRSLKTMYSPDFTFDFTLGSA